MKIKVLLTVFIIIINPISGIAQVGVTGASFLLISPDARARAMGQGGSVYSTGAKSAYYNPANLASSGLASADIIYCKYFPALADNVSFISLDASRDFGKWGHWGLGYFNLHFGDYLLHDENFVLYKVPGTSESALTLYSAFDINPDASAGFGLKYISVEYLYAQNRVAAVSSFAFDFGIQIRNRLMQATLIHDENVGSEYKNNDTRMAEGGIALGLSISNLGPEIKYSHRDKTLPLPRNLRLATGYQMINSKIAKLKITIDAEKLLVDMNDKIGTEWKEVIWNYGLEVQIYRLVVLRGGLLNDQIGRLRYWTTGFAFGPDWLQADFSYIFKSDKKWNRMGGEYSIGLAANLFSMSFK